jgi:hypothetical protein
MQSDYRVDLYEANEVSKIQKVKKTVKAIHSLPSRFLALVISSQAVLWLSALPSLPVTAQESGSCISKVSHNSVGDILQNNCSYAIFVTWWDNSGNCPIQSPCSQGFDPFQKQSVPHIGSQVRYAVCRSPSIPRINRQTASFDCP